VENGIDVKPFVALNPPLFAGDPVIGTIGRLEPVKDHVTLLRAFDIIASRYPSARLRLLGDGSERARLGRLAAELGISDRVEFCGFSLETAQFLAAIDVFVISSVSEGLPLSLLEAMAAARPVVSTAVGAISDVVRSAGGVWLCPPSDFAALAGVLIAALESGDRQELGLKARELVVAKYSVQALSRRYMDIYSSQRAGKA
jgi:glycosyltransferase involved in cell wall biosynthesis